MTAAANIFVGWLVGILTCTCFSSWVAYARQRTAEKQNFNRKIGRFVDELKEGK
jgi:hypothetical protein